MGDKKFEKQKIYYTRTYRHLLVNKKGSILYFLLLVLPSLIALLLFYGRITELVSALAVKAFGFLDPTLRLGHAEHEFIPGLSMIHIVTVPSSYPKPGFILMNIGAVLLILTIALSGKRRIKPISIYLSIMMFVHVINCLFFLFAGKEFPYTPAQYSELYMKQQVGIWICFLIIIGLVTGLLGVGSYTLRVVVFVSVMLYSFVFGTVRYILFLYIIHRWSLIYMALFFFALGPFFDFLYLVSIYGFYINKMTDIYTDGKRKEDWVWS